MTIASLAMLVTGRLSRVAGIAAPQVSAWPRAGGPKSVSQFMLELGRRPWWNTGAVPLVQERPGLVYCQVEPVNEHAGCVVSSIVAALAGEGGRNSREVGGRPG
jgi:hypothetical protein